jgi:hypothetical protein
MFAPCRAAPRPARWREDGVCRAAERAAGAGGGARGNREGDRSTPHERHPRGGSRLDHDLRPRELGFRHAPAPCHAAHGTLDKNTQRSNDKIRSARVISAGGRAPALRAPRPLRATPQQLQAGRPRKLRLELRSSRRSCAERRELLPSRGRARVVAAPAARTRSTSARTDGAASTVAVRAATAAAGPPPRRSARSASSISGRWRRTSCARLPGSSSAPPERCASRSGGAPLPPNGSSGWCSKTGWPTHARGGCTPAATTSHARCSARAL